MESSEHLELSFNLHPDPSISSCVVTSDDAEIIQKDFEGRDCPDEWLTALKAVAAATKNIDSPKSPDASLTGSGSPSLRESNASSKTGQGASRRGSHRSPASPSRQISFSPARQTSFRDLCDLSRTWPYSRVVSQDILGAYHASNTFACGQFQEALGSEFDHNVLIDSSPAFMLDIGQFATEDRATDQVFQSPSLFDTVHHASSVQVEYNTDVASNDNSSPESVTSPPTAMLRRKQKLEARLEAIRHQYVPDQEQSNNTVRRLCNDPPDACDTVTSMEQMGLLLGRLGTISSTLGIIYSLLSWEIFRWEEERLVQVEGYSLIVAAKRVSKY